MSLSYDLTGRDPNFKRTDARFAVFMEEQVISFDEPVYVESIVVRHLLGGNTTELTADIDWLITKNSYDYDAISQAKVMDAAFTRTLVKNIVLKIFRTGETESQVSVDYQRFQKSYVAEYDPDGDGPAYSPSLMKDMLDRITQLEAIKNPVNDLVTDDLNKVTFLEVDKTGLATANYVLDELQSINVPAGQPFLRPAYGSFYAHDVVVKSVVTRSIPISKVKATGFYDVYRTGTVGSGYPLLTRAQQMSEQGVALSGDGTRIRNTSEINSPIKDVATGRLLITSADIAAGLVAVYEEETMLTQGEDYNVSYANLPKTRQSTHPSGVYEVIYFLAPLVGNVKVSYHAYGGTVSPFDVTKLQSALIDIITVLQNNGYLTPEDVDKLTVIQTIIKRLDKMEEFHRHFLQIERNVAVVDENRHWYPIAFIYDDRWSGIDDGTDDIGQFRVESLEREWVYDFVVTANLSAIGHRKFMLDTMKSCDPNYVFSQNDYRGACNGDMIQARLVWVGDGKSSGVVLQLGIKYDKLVGKKDVDLLVVTNKSGGASRWRLSEPSLNVVQPQDTQVTMPGRVTVWNSGSVNHNSIIKTLEPPNGLLLYAGSMAMRPFGTPAQLPLFSEDITADFQPWHVKELEFAFFDRKDGEWVYARQAVHLDNFDGLGSTDSESGNELVFFFPDLCGIRYRMLQLNGFVFFVEACLGSSSFFNDRFDLRQVVAHLN